MSKLHALMAAACLARLLPGATALAGGGTARRAVELRPGGGLGELGAAASGAGGGLGSKNGTNASNATNGSGVGTKNLVLLFDGAGCTRDATCSVPLSAPCQSNVAELYRIVPASEGVQLTWYDSGLGTQAEDAGDIAAAVKRHGLRAYQWLMDNYEPGDKIFVFAFSRGTVSARFLQGFINLVGLAKPGHTSEALSLLHRNNTDAIKAFKGNASHVSSKAWPDVKVHFMGLFDALLRTMWFPIKPGPSSDVEAMFHMKLSPCVETLYHAMALDEYRELLEVGELIVEPSTKAEQVWFFGLHSEVGGGYPNFGPRNVPLGWIADAAAEHGLLLQPGWADLPRLRPSFSDDVHVERGLGAMRDEAILAGGRLRIRNPAKCRAKAFGKTKLKFHKSVQDRMNEVRGWVPLPYCCPQTRKGIKESQIEWVSNAHYDSNMKAHPPELTPHWMKLKFGDLSHAKVPAVGLSYFVKVQNWHSSMPLLAGRSAADSMMEFHRRSGGRTPSGGCCTEHRGDAPRNASALVIWDGARKTASMNFTGLELVLPVETAVADTIIVEVFEDNVENADNFVGRAELALGDDALLKMQKRKLKPEGNGIPATLEVMVEYIADDNTVEASLGGGSPAQCQWLKLHTGKRGKELCGIEADGLDWFFEQMKLKSKEKACDAYKRKITIGV